jgi:hypothetical protein
MTMPKTNKDVIIEYTNLIEKKLELFAEEPYRVWTDSAENRAKEARYSKWYEFHYGEASEQPDPLPVGADGTPYYRMCTVAMLMKAPTPDLGFGLGVAGLKALGTGYNGPTHLAVMCPADSFWVLIGRELAGATEDGGIHPPKRHLQRLKALWAMLRHVESIAIWPLISKAGKPWWPKDVTAIEAGDRWANLVKVEIRSKLVTNQPHNVFSREWRADPNKGEAHHIDDGIFEEDEKRKVRREGNAMRKQLAQFRDAE